MSKKNGIICIETEWVVTSKKSRLKLNTEMLLKFLHDSCDMPYIYRRVATKNELLYYLKQFRKKEYNNFNIIYFSFHGQTQEIYLEEGVHVSLDDLCEYADGLFEDKFIHFSSCRTFLGSQKKLEDFKVRSKAKFISGYTKSVHAELSAIHDLALFQQLQTHKTVLSIKKKMDSLYSGLESSLGFRIIV